MTKPKIVGSGVVRYGWAKHYIAQGPFCVQLKTQSPWAMALGAGTRSNRNARAETSVGSKTISATDVAIGAEIGSCARSATAQSSVGQVVIGHLREGTVVPAARYSLNRSLWDGPYIIRKLTSQDRAHRQPAEMIHL